MNQEIIASVLFADVKGYSKLKNDRDKAKLLTSIRRVVKKHILSVENHFFTNTWGDGFIICSYRPVDAAEIALRMRDTVRTTDWKSQGFAQDFSIRVALHAQTITVIRGENNKIEDVSGVGVDTAARIEPIVDPDNVFCSEMFYRLLKQQSPQKIKAVALGKRELAKDYGAMKLYQLSWRHETATAPGVPSKAAPVPAPTIKLPVTDKQRTEFVRGAYSTIKSYFKRALKNLQAQNPDVETDVQEITSMKFTCSVYVHGNLRNQCKIWISKQMSLRESLAYAEGTRIDANNDNMMNETIWVEDDGTEIYLKQPFIGIFAASNAIREKASPEQVAEALWNRFTRPLIAR